MQACIDNKKSKKREKPRKREREEKKGKVCMVVLCEEMRPEKTIHQETVWLSSINNLEIEKTKERKGRASMMFVFLSVVN